MRAQTPSTFKLIGAGVTSVGALAAIFGSGGSNAQTLANLQESDRAAYLQTHCGHIRDGAQEVGCRAQASIDFDTARAETARKQAAEHQKAAAKDREAAGAARTAAQCLSVLSAALTANPPRITVAEARAAKTTPTPSDDPCEWVRRLQPRLGALKQ